AAWLNATSSRPNAPTVRSTRVRTEAGSETSVGTASARPPLAANSRASASSAAASRAASATAAPAATNALAVAAPMPRLAPVMMATRPSSSNSLMTPHPCLAGLLSPVLKKLRHVARIGVEPAHRDQRQPQVAHPREHAVQRRLIRQRPAQGGVPGGIARHLQAREPVR